MCGALRESALARKVSPPMESHPFSFAAQSGDTDRQPTSEFYRALCDKHKPTNFAYLLIICKYSTNNKIKAVFNNVVVEKKTMATGAKR